VNNLVNDKPLYYALNESGLVINGSLYGEIILANCSESSISEGEFYDSTDGILLYLSYRNNISDVYMTGQNRAVYFYESDNNTLRDSTIEYCEESDTVWFESSEYCTIQNVNMTNISSPGIYLYDSRYTTIELCSFQDINEITIEVESSDYVLLQNSTFYNIDGTGVYFYDSFYATVQYCEFQNIAEDGIALEMDSEMDYCNAVFLDNDFTNVSVGIYGYYYSVAMYIGYNDFMWCDVGIYTQYADYSYFERNYFHDNEWGMLLDDTYDVEVANNTFYWNRIGLEMYGDMGNFAYYNVFGPNFEYSGYDDGMNVWDDNVDTGNYWYDFDGTVPFPIQGGSNVDRYPMAFTDIPTEPIINTPMDIWYSEGTEGHYIDWFPIDDNTKNWIVEIDGVEVAGDAWNFKNITFNVDGLAYGVNEVNITVFDIYANNASDTVIVTVYDDTPPEIDGPPDTWLFVGLDQTITWEVSDLNPDNYTVYLNDEVYETGTWTTGDLEIDFDGVSEGLYEVRVVLHDIDDNAESDTLMFLMILDDTDPLIDNPEGIVYVEGTTGNTIEWTPIDEFPDLYEVSFNGTPLLEDDWGGSRISVNVDGLPVGTWEFTLTVYDTSGNSVTDTVNVTVLPLIQEPPMQEVDWVLLIIVGAVVGAVVVVIALVYYLKKKKGAAG
jgi:parallel beta-helix repeat protein